MFKAEAHSDPGFVWSGNRTDGACVHPGHLHEAFAGVDTDLVDLLVRVLSAASCAVLISDRDDRTDTETAAGDLHPGQAVSGIVAGYLENSRAEFVRIMFHQRKSVHRPHQRADAFVSQRGSEENGKELPVPDHGAKIVLPDLFCLQIVFQNTVIADSNILCLIFRDLQHRVKLNSGKIHALRAEIIPDIAEKICGVRTRLIHLIYEKKCRNSVMCEKIPEIPDLPDDAIRRADNQDSAVENLKNPLCFR